MSKLFVTLLLALGLSAPAFAVTGVNPSSLKIKVYGVYASTSTTCTDPITIFSSEGGTITDFLNSPQLGGGNIPDGTYPCIIIKMGDMLRVTPAQNSDSCVAGTEYAFDVCRDNSYTTYLDGSTVECLGATQVDGIDNVVYLYLSTAAGNGNEAFRSPAQGAANGMRLLAPFVVAGSSVGTFVVDGTGQVDEGGGNCSMGPPTFSFR